MLAALKDSSLLINCTKVFEVLMSVTPRVFAEAPGAVQVFRILQSYLFVLRFSVQDKGYMSQKHSNSNHCIVYET